MSNPPRQPDLESAIAHHRAGRLAQAAAIYRQIIQHASDNAAAHSNLGAALMDLGNVPEAISSLQIAIRLKPGFSEAYSNLGNALRLQGKNHEAIACYEKAIALNPRAADACNNLGNCLNDCGRGDEALAWLNRAVELKPDFAIAWNNLGVVLQGMARSHEAIEAFRRSIGIDPNLIQAHLDLAASLLRIGRYEEGWEEAEWRWRLPSARKREWVKPPWEGGALYGQTILLYAEQGLGDTIQFIRYAPLIAQRAGNVIVECPRALKRVVESVPGIQKVFSSGEDLDDFDVRAPLMSLPRLLRTTVQTIPANVPYLWASPALFESWQARIPQHGRGLRVGLVWAGGALPTRKRSTSFQQLAPLAELPGVTFFSLQKGDAAAQASSPPPRMHLIDLSSDLHDFAETAAVISNLDLVISVDTAVAHLAGAMSKPVWTLLQFVSDWRWMIDREDNPWYPTMRLFRQSKAGEWGPVVERVAHELAARAGGG
jgi:tetratricopeptide (TPR) repeat protein